MGNRVLRNLSISAGAIQELVTIPTHTTSEHRRTESLPAFHPALLSAARPLPVRSTALTRFALIAMPLRAAAWTSRISEHPHPPKAKVTSRSSWEGSAGGSMLSLA